MASQTKSREDLWMFVNRLMHFINLWTIYGDILDNKYVPMGSDVEPFEARPQATIMMILYSYFYSLVEDSSDGINGFRVWREHFPEEYAAISAVENQVRPFVDRLKMFRNRIGFHGSRTREHQLKGLELFNQHSGTEIWNAMKNFKALATALLRKDSTGTPPETRTQIDAIAARAQSET